MENSNHIHKVLFKTIQMSSNNDALIRNKKLRNNSIMMFLIKGLSLLISLLYVPLLLNTLNAEKYGVWITITTLVSWINIMDIGFGNGLRNKLSGSLANKDYELSAKYVSSAYVALGSLSALLLILFLGVNQHINWNKMFNIYSIDISELRIIVAVVFISFCISIVLNLINSIMYALQKPAMISFMTLFVQLISYGVIYLNVNYLGFTTLLQCCVVISVTPIIVLSLFTIVYLKGNDKFKPRFKFVNFSIIKDIMSLGVQFFVIQIITICLYQTNNIVLAQFHNIESVSEYNIAFKYMNTLYFAYMIIVTPVWSATTEAYILKDYAWIKKLEFKLMKIWFIMLIVGAILILISSRIYTLWLNGAILQSDQLLLSLLLCLILSQAMYGNYGFIINGIGKLRAQIVITGTLAFFYIPVTIYFVKLFGLYGVVISGIIINLINICWSRFQFKKLISADFKQNSFWTQ